MSNTKTSSKNAANAAGLTQSVMRVMHILNCFSDETPELRVTDISVRLSLTPSLVSRLLATLEHEGYVEQDSATGLYRLGRTILTMAGVALNHNRLRMEAMQGMQAASTRIGLGVNLAVRDRDAIFYLAHIETPEAPRPYTLIGRRNPLHATAMGKIILAYLPELEAKALIASLSLTAYTVNTFIDAKDLMRELEQVRNQGWAVEMEELALGRACISGPIRDASGAVIGTLSLSGPLSQVRWAQRRTELSGEIIELCDRISMRLGYITAPSMG